MSENFLKKSIKENLFENALTRHNVNNVSITLDSFEIAQFQAFNRSSHSSIPPPSRFSGNASGEQRSAQILSCD